MNKLTVKQAQKITIRAWKVWWEQNPAIFISMFLDQLISGITPYVAIFFSARLIDEIAGNREVTVLRNLALMALVSALFLGILLAGLRRWKNVQVGSLWRTQEIILGQKMLKMDFISIDDSRIKNLKSQIQQNAWSVGY